MFQILRNAWKIPDLRTRILFTIGMLVIFRIGSFITVPLLNSQALQQLMQNNGISLLGFLDTITGGAFGKATIFAMSITPYINASIIMQLLTVAIPSLERLAREGDEGRKILGQYTRYGTVVLGFIQAAGFYVLLNNMKVVTTPNTLSFIVITLSFTAGTAFLMWLGEQINERGIGNGISLLIFAGIVARIPAMIQALVVNMQNGKLNYFTLTAFLLLGVGVVASVVIMNQAERRIPVQYAKRVVGRKMYGGQSTHIPIKVNLAGVIPIIFAMSICAFPSTIAQFFQQNSKIWSTIYRLFSPSSWLYAILYFILILFFTYFYTAIQFNPIEIANNMKKNGGFVPGIRPGKPTSDYINRVLSRITLAGAIFLAIIAVLPIILSTGAGLNIGLGGTTILIVVGVALETVKQMESQMLMRHYKGFLE